MPLDLAEGIWNYSAIGFSQNNISLRNYKKGLQKKLDAVIVVLAKAKLLFIIIAMG